MTTRCCRFNTDGGCQLLLTRHLRVVYVHLLERRLLYDSIMQTRRLLSSASPLRACMYTRGYTRLQMLVRLVVVVLVSVFVNSWRECSPSCVGPSLCVNVRVVSLTASETNCSRLTANSLPSSDSLLNTTKLD